MLFHDVLTMQKPWPGDHGLFLLFTDFYWVYIHVLYPLSYKAYNHPTLRTCSTTPAFNASSSDAMQDDSNDEELNKYSEQFVVSSDSDTGWARDRRRSGKGRPEKVCKPCVRGGWVSYITEASNWYWPKNGQCLLSSQKKMLFRLFLHLYSFPLSYVIHHFHLHSYLFSPFL